MTPKLPPKRHSYQNCGKPIKITDKDRETVFECAGLGMTHEQISHLVCGGISLPTLRKHFRKELDEGLASQIKRCTGKLQEHINNGNDRALVFFLKCRANWRETERHEITGADGGPLEFRKVKYTIVDPKKESEEDGK